MRLPNLYIGMLSLPLRNAFLFGRVWLANALRFGAFIQNGMLPPHVHVTSVLFRVFVGSPFFSHLVPKPLFAHLLVSVHFTVVGAASLPGGIERSDGRRFWGK